MFGSNRFSPENAPVLEDDHYQPYARRSVGQIFTFVFLLALGAGFLLWYLGSGDSKDGSAQITATNLEMTPDGELIPAPPTAAQQQAATSNDKGIIEEGKDLVKDTIQSVTGQVDGTAIVEAEQAIKQQAMLMAKMKDDSQRHTVADIIGKPVLAADEESVGKINDIIINKNTGEAAVIVVDAEGQGYRQKLTELDFKDVRKQTPNGSVYLNVDNKEFTSNEAFQYESLPENYMSLRDLHDGQVLDFEGKLAGEVRTVVYRNAEVQKIYFLLKPSLSPNMQPVEFGIPFEKANIVKNKDGYDVKLTKAQTEDLAKQLYTEPQPQL